MLWELENQDEMELFHQFSDPGTRKEIFILYLDLELVYKDEFCTTH